jgi:hypothetical protein
VGGEEQVLAQQRMRYSLFTLATQRIRY